MIKNYNDKLLHRMGTKKLKLTNSEGNLVKNQEILVEQVKHKFLFGCAEFNSIPFANDEFDEADKKIYKDRFEKLFDLFNYVTLPFYWENFEKDKGKPDIERLKNAAQWIKSRGCTLKGHPLCWHTLAPSWLLNMSNDQILTTQLNRIEREVCEFSGLIDIWDVINEAVIMPVFDKYDNGITRVCKEMGRIRTIREMFSAAKKVNPNATFLINDFVHISIDSYDILIEGCLEAGIPINAIGIQSHMHKGFWGIERMQEVLERFSRFNLPIHFTESTLLSGHFMPMEIVDFNDYVIDNWESTEEGEERQAREAVLFYRTLFESPKVESITWWEFIDGQWLNAPSGFITKDNRVKPIYDEMYKLVKGEWWTEPSCRVTDESGNVLVSGFTGEYEITYNGKRNRFYLDKGHDSAEINVKLK